jgi:hypothetical protein
MTRSNIPSSRSSMTHRITGATISVHRPDHCATCCPTPGDATNDPTGILSRRLPASRHECTAAQYSHNFTAVRHSILTTGTTRHRLVTQPFPLSPWSFVVCAGCEAGCQWAPLGRVAQHYLLAGSRRGEVVVFAGLWARGVRRLARRGNRRWRHRCPQRAASAPGSAAVLLPRTEGSGPPATNPVRP